MIGSFEDLMLAINKGREDLGEDLARYCEYLESFGWKDGELACFFSPGHSCITPFKDEPLPPWFTEKLLDIIKAFAAKGAYGSIVAVLYSLRMKLEYKQACAILIAQIHADRRSAAPSITPEAYNYIYLACVYTDLVSVWKYLLTHDLADINYQAGKFKVAAIHYAIKFSSHTGFMKFLEFAHARGKFNPNLQDRWGTTALFFAANQLYFNRSLPISTKLQEITKLLELGANVFLLNNATTSNQLNRSVLSEVWRVANQNGAETLLLQYGAGLVKLEYRDLQEQGRYRSSLITERERSIPGFNHKLYVESDVVLVGRDKTNNQLVWLYGMDKVCTALRDPNIEIYREQIAKQLQVVDPQILGSSRVLQEFLPFIPRALIMDTPTTPVATAVAESAQPTADVDGNRCVLC